ncbi:MAG: RidA family protein [Spirochaetales bacterium]|nr:RidA family protein [Spirochaetales bacterium]
MILSQRLKELGLTLPDVPPPVAAYVPARISGGLVYTSGQLPLKKGHLLLSGSLHREDQVADAALAAEQCFLNALAAALQMQVTLQGVLKLTVFVASGPDFIWQHLVANGASALAQKVFGESGQHVRSAVGVSSLPLNASVELEAIFATAI